MFLSSHSYFLAIFAGLAFFMYGLDYVSNSLRELMGNRVRDLLAKLTNSKLLSIIVGILLTLLMQSSGAVTSLLVALGKARVTTLRQVMGVIIGSAIGSTITVQLISFKIAEIGLPIFTVGFFAYFLAKKPFHKNITGILLGFGLVFFGLELMSLGAGYIKEIDTLKNVFSYLSTNPWMSLLITAMVTAVVHSSAVTVGLAMTLVATGTISLYDSLFWVFGANLGTTSTALMTAMGGNAIGRQVAWANVLFKVGSLLLLCFIPSYFLKLVEFFGDTDSSRTVANAHTLFNFVGAIAFYPFIELGAKALQNWIKPTKAEREFGPKYLDQKSIMTPVIAFSEAAREVNRMGDIVLYMVKDSIKVFEVEDVELIRDIHDSDNKVDLLQREIKDFLISTGSGDESLKSQILQMISFVSDLESAADVVDRSIVELARKKHALKLNFSSEGWKELRGFHAEVMEMGKMSLSCFQLQDKDLAQRVIEKKRSLTKLENDLRASHFERLNRGLQDSQRTSSIHMDALADYRRICSIFCHHAYEVLKNGHKLGS